jgi:hypothetical protein
MKEAEAAKDAIARATMRRFAALQSTKCQHLLLSVVNRVGIDSLQSSVESSNNRLCSFSMFFLCHNRHCRFDVRLLRWQLRCQVRKQFDIAKPHFDNIW